MEKSVDWQFDSYMQEIFQMKEVDIREYSPLALAYIGDCIFDLVIKSLVMNEGNIIEQGTHEELLKKNGFYANLYNSQFEKTI